MTLLAALAGAITISFSAIFFALSDAAPISGAFFRGLYALPGLFLVWWWRRHLDDRPRAKRLTALGAGVFLGFDVVAWHVAIDYLGAGLATLIANSQVVVVALVAWMVLGEKPRRTVLWAIPVVLVGVAMISGLGRGDAFGENPVVGAVLAVLAAFLYAGFLLVFRSSNSARVPVAGPLMEATAGLVLTSLVLGVVTGGLDLVPDWPGHGWLAALALGTQAGGWLLIGYTLPRLPAAETATIILLQPMLTMVWGMIIFTERPSPLQLAGALLVLTGVGFVAITGARGALARRT